MTTLTAKQIEVMNALQAAFDRFSVTGSVSGYHEAKATIKHFSASRQALVRKGIVEAIDHVDGATIWYVHPIPAN